MTTSGKTNITYWFVYILKCADGTYYTGVTNDLPKRIETHNNKQGAKYTRGRLPVRLVYSEQCKGKSKAMKREFELKKLKRAEKIKLITDTKIKDYHSA